MLRKPYLLTILAAFTLVFSSCEKDKDKEDPKPTLESQLTQKTWTLDEQEVLFDGQSEPQDILEVVHNAVGTDDIAFKLDGKGEYVILLDGDEEDEGDYQLEGDKITWEYPLTYLYGSSDENEHEYTVKINGSTLTLTAEGTDSQGDDFKETIKFKAN